MKKCIGLIECMCLNCVCVCVCVFQSCSVVDPITDYEFNLQPLATKTGYRTEANGKLFLVGRERHTRQCPACSHLSWNSAATY